MICLADRKEILRPEDFAGVYKDLAEIIGAENVKRLFLNMRGQQVTFPQKLYSKEYVIKRAKEVKEKTEMKKLAIEFGYTERRLQQLAKED